MEGGVRSVEGGGWRVKGGGWRVEGGRWRVDRSGGAEAVEEEGKGACGGCVGTWSFGTVW